MISTTGIPGKMNNQIHWLKFCPLEGFPFKSTQCEATVLQLSPVCFCLVSAYHAEPHVNQTPFSLSKLTMEPPIRGRKNYSRKRSHGYMGYLLMKLTCTLRTFSRSVSYISYISLLLYDRMLLCMPNSMTWWIRQHSVHDRQLS